MPTVEPQGRLCKEVYQMLYDLSPGDVMHIGETVTLNVVAVEGNLIHFGLESTDGECPDTGLGDRQQHDPKQVWWELN
jgi:hypothetical protein